MSNSHIGSRFADFLADEGIVPNTFEVGDIVAPKMDPASIYWRATVIAVNDDDTVTVRYANGFRQSIWVADLVLISNG